MQRPREYFHSRFVGEPRGSPTHKILYNCVSDLASSAILCDHNERPNPAVRRCVWLYRSTRLLRSVLTGSDANNRFRIIHSDKETRPLARRLHRYAAAGSRSDEDEGLALDHERDMIRLEALKWKLGVERMLGSVKNLERQRATYLVRADETGMLFPTKCTQKTCR